ncbi:hypothetical protein B296_00044365 [Ensete ventricosum]|uniref:Uncharacterized protein n=1 Tax=Ensete ventricosum TaxID=4639 RepID=A0A426YWX4_ENSVE|nr:hypothetical protein B296_00044365 [Ensete ventricosum]
MRPLVRKPWDGGERRGVETGRREELNRRSFDWVKGAWERVEVCREGKDTTGT